MAEASAVAKPRERTSSTLTAKAMPDAREQALAAGANGYIAKPFEVDELVSSCRVWLPR